MPPSRGLRIYIDDSGEKEYGERTSRYFVYAGVVVDRGEEDDLNAEIDALKIETFGTAGIEIKSNWLRIPKEQSAHYLKPFGITGPALRAFVAKLYRVMRSDRMTYVAAAVDKTQMQEKYASPYYASALAYLFVLQRYQKHSARLDALGYVTMDDMSGSSPKKNEWRDLLRTQHARLKKDGCQFTKLRFDNIAERLLFADSRRFNLLQVADLVAYNVYRQFREHGNIWDQGTATMPLYLPLGALARRFMLADDGKLAGWGIVKWPVVQRRGWRVNLS